MAMETKRSPLDAAQQFKFINNLTPIERKAFLDSFDTVFCDCDGVIWQTLRDTISGSAEAIQFLRQIGKRITFVTNNSICSTEDHLNKFEHCGIVVQKREIIHPAQTVCDHLKSINFEGLIFCLATKPFRKLLQAAGFQLLEERESGILETPSDLRDAIRTPEPVKAVIIDVDFNMSVSKLMRAHIYLRDPNCLFIGGAADVVISFAGGDIIGSGPFINVVEICAKRSATILGKPGKALGDILKRLHNVKDPRRVLFVGDSLTSDIQFGNVCGFQTLLVLSGGTKLQDLQGPLAETEKPDYVANALADFIAQS